MSVVQLQPTSSLNASVMGALFAIGAEFGTLKSSQMA